MLVVKLKVKQTAFVQWIGFSSWFLFYFKFMLNKKTKKSTDCKNLENSNPFSETE